MDSNSDSSFIIVLKAFVVSSIGSAFAEMAALPFYYPYELMKVRMQTMNAKYGYKNFIDGLFKIWNEKRAQPGLLMLSGQAK